MLSPRNIFAPSPRPKSGRRDLNPRPPEPHRQAGGHQKRQVCRFTKGSEHRCRSFLARKRPFLGQNSYRNGYRKKARDSATWLPKKDRFSDQTASQNTRACPRPPNRRIRGSTLNPGLVAVWHETRRSGGSASAPAVAVLCCSCSLFRSTSQPLVQGVAVEAVFAVEVCVGSSRSPYCQLFT